MSNINGKPRFLDKIETGFLYDKLSYEDKKHNYLLVELVRTLEIPAGLFLNFNSSK